MEYRFDIRGNRVEVVDPKGRVCIRNRFGLGGSMLWSWHLDGGIRTTVTDCVGVSVELRDSKGSLILTANEDDLLRPTRTWARDVSGEATRLVSKTIYTSAPSLTLPNAQQDNLLGAVYESWDEAGLNKIPAFDFRGLPLYKTQQVIKDSVILDIFNGAAANNWQVDCFKTDWSQLSAADLDAPYRTDFEYDALGRATKVTLPDDLDGERKEAIPTFNRAGAMEKITLKSTSRGDTDYVEHIAYNAKGQRLLVAYGNGLMQRYAYDPQNFRLLRVTTEGFSHPTGQPYTFSPQSGSEKQDNVYSFDLVGNITELLDHRDDSGVGGTANLQRDFSYDPFYRLLTASGRESTSHVNGASPWDRSPSPTANVNDTRAYVRTYKYDELGNVLHLNHNAGTQGSFNRYWNDFNTSPLTAYQTNNLLNSVEYGSGYGNRMTYSYDACGNQILEGASRHFEWDFGDNIRVFYNQVGTSEPTEYAHYLYSGGTRVKKIVRKQGGSAVVTNYLDGFDHLYKLDAQRVKSEEHQELAVMDGRSRIGRLRMGNAFAGDVSPAVTYCLEDHRIPPPNPPCKFHFSFGAQFWGNNSPTRLTG